MKKPNIVIKPVAGAQPQKQQAPAPMTEAEIRARIRMNATQRFEQYAQGILYNILANRADIAQPQTRVDSEGIEHHTVSVDDLKANVRAAIDAALDGAGYLLTTTGDKLDPVVDAIVEKAMAVRAAEQEKTKDDKAN